ncbi:MAG: hypothetical protein WC476_08880 [Phycisphaerae bacterium]|jgi:hypothetical protein
MSKGLPRSLEALYGRVKDLEDGGIGAIGDDTITNTKLATDAKVGSLAALTTTVKTSFQAAINEVDADIGAPASLTTNAKTNLVAAVNELDADMGNPATLTTTSKTIVGAINEIQGGEAAEVSLTGIQTMTNKTLTSPILTTPKVADGDAGLTITSADQAHAEAVATVPNLGDAADEFVMKDTVQTLTGKRLTSPKINEDVVLSATATQLNRVVVLQYPANHVYHVDGSRTDTYTEDGSVYRPYKTLLAAANAINAVSVTLLGSAADFELCKFIINLAPGKYTDNVSLLSARYIRINMEGAEISGDITIAQEQQGLTDYYGKIEFYGGNGNRANRGNCGLISGNVTFTKTAYDSLAYSVFSGIHFSGNLSYGTAAIPTDGTWVLCLENTYFSGTDKYISSYPVGGSECLLIESYGYNYIKAHISKQDGDPTAISLYDCNDTYFDLVNITPVEDCRVKNCTFNSTTSIVAAKTISLDANSFKSLKTAAPTLTGMTLVALDGFAVDAGINVRYVKYPLTIAANTDPHDTAIVIPAGSIIKNVWVHVATKEDTGTTKTVDIGISGGDEDGFLAGVSVAVAGIIKGTLDNAGQTLGAELCVDEDGAGALVPEPYVCAAETTICYTLGSSNFAELVANVIVEYVEII